jgi:hypothetical protein
MSSVKSWGGFLTTRTIRNDLEDRRNIESPRPLEYQY